MKASELVMALQLLIAIHGDLDVCIYDDEWDVDYLLTDVSSSTTKMSTTLSGSLTDTKHLTIS